MFEIISSGPGNVALSGRLDASQISRASAVLGEISESITVDLSDLDYISSAGIGLIVATNKRLRKSGHTLKCVSVKPYVRTIFQYANLLELLDID